MIRKNKSPVSKSLMIVLSLLAVLAGSLAMAAVEDQIRARLELGSGSTVCEFGQECAAGMVMPNSGGPKTPEGVYQTYCTACHGTGVNNAPVFGNIEAWAPRIAKGVDALYESALNGFNNGAMPPRGTCMDCTVDDLHAAVDYMVQSSQ